jgi:hypothetical protein
MAVMDPVSSHVGSYEHSNEPLGLIKDRGIS